MTTRVCNTREQCTCVNIPPDLTFASCPGVQVTFQMQIQTHSTTEHTHTHSKLVLGQQPLPMATLHDIKRR